MKITVAIPVYNGARHIVSTIDSVAAQTFEDFELVLIEDNSTDDSLAVISDRIRVDDRMRIVRTPTNGGSAGIALNWALPTFLGERFVYSSQDDCFSPDWLETMHNRAIEAGADAVIPVLVLERKGDQITSIKGLHGDRERVITGREAVVYSLDWTIPGNALWPMEIVRRHGFAEFAMNGDEYSVRQFYHDCETVAFCDGIFYYNNRNPDAVTKKLDPGTFDLPITHLRLCRFLADHGYAEKYQNDELERAASSLIWSARRLKNHPQVRDAADARIERALAAFREDPMVVRALRRHPSWLTRMKGYAVTSGRRSFDGLVRLMPAA